MPGQFQVSGRISGDDGRRESCIWSAQSYLSVTYELIMCLNFGARANFFVTANGRSESKGMRVRMGDELVQRKRILHHT